MLAYFTLVSLPFLVISVSIFNIFKYYFYTIASNLWCYKEENPNRAFTQALSLKSSPKHERSLKIVRISGSLVNIEPKLKKHFKRILFKTFNK